MPVTMLTLTPPDAEWMNQASCAGRWDVMEAATPMNEHDAKLICSTCPVRTECLAWSLSLPPREDVDGVAGGMTREERMKARRRQRRAFITEKRCSVCGEVKPRSEFYPHSGRASGIGTNCKPCHNRLRTERRRAARKAASA